MQIKSRIRTIAHYPHEGIMFRDITTLLKDPIGLRATVQEIANELAKDYNAPLQEILADTISMLQELSDKGVIKA